jgi:ABC-2 type transport system permease protein
MGYIMFFMIILFGTQVMRSVSEEKVNRIVEVIISSVKPFELMLGKILGSSAVSLTQILIWLLIVPISSIMIKIFIPSDSESISEIAASGQIPDGLDQIPFVIEQIGNMNWWLILPLFIFYFITGFLIYAAMFAAIGAAIGDDINDSQTLTMPVVIPIVLAVYIMFQVVREPHSTLAVWSSIFPFFSSIIMPTRLPYQPEYWQIILSVVTTLGTAILMIWLAGRIYRIGIMMYGKKASFKDLFKWLFKKEL